ncbi:hypothetical protein [Saccharopolyspora phatthalungensis]|uniref:Abi-like protein n=1 Tax=Saccharopolyspora phatthalungensis TaxID=664693 RepID=A0A840Q2H1_9PSEU|nr:hypothetical protein [Saccharopolyspora phatthalungensis]MBB5154644.1 hypothetical protein [Saccharopolyspora phatthalungensis]
MRCALSAPRFERYRKAADGRIDVAIQLYQRNIDISAAFYHPLHWLEVGLRNAINQRLRDQYSRLDWWVDVPLDKHDSRKIENVLENVASRRRTADDIVAQPTFGFWVALLHKRNDRRFWVPSPHKAFPHYKGPRARLHDDFYKMRNFRNRIMHHEPIFYLDLEEYRQRGHRLLGYLSPDALRHVQTTDRLTEVLDQRDRAWRRLG